MEELKALAIQDRGRKVLAVPEDWDGDDLALGYITKAPTTGRGPGLQLLRCGRALRGAAGRVMRAGLDLRATDRFGCKASLVSCSDRLPYRERLPPQKPPDQSDRGIP
jgi:hypothetical protein